MNKQVTAIDLAALVCALPVEFRRDVQLAQYLIEHSFAQTIINCSLHFSAPMLYILRLATKVCGRCPSPKASRLALLGSQVSLVGSCAFGPDTWVCIWWISRRPIWDLHVWIHMLLAYHW